MTDYTKTTDFAAKDLLSPGNANKIIKGAEFEVEFDDIATAIATKANLTSPTFTGTTTIPTVDINAGNIDGTTIGASSPAAGTFTTLATTGNVTLGDSAADTVTVTADVASHLIPSTDNTYDLGASGSEWRNLYIDGTGNIDSLVADTADINGGTIDGATLGASSQVTITNGDMNGGSIDGTTVGASSPSTGAFTTLSSSSTTALASGATIGGVTAVTTTDTQTLTNKTLTGYVETTNVVGSSASVTLEGANGSIYTVTLSGAGTITDSLANGESITLVISPNGNNVTTWPTATWLAIGGSGTAPSDISGNTTTVIQFFKVASVLYAVHAGDA